MGENYRGNYSLQTQELRGLDDSQEQKKKNWDIQALERGRLLREHAPL